MKLSFLNMHWLYALFALLVLAYLLFKFEKNRIERTRKLSNSNQKLNVSFVRLSLLPLFIVLLLIISLSRPYYGMHSVKVPGISRDILVIQDISKSMLVTDIKPSRLEFSKRKLEDLIRITSSNASTDRIGLVLFAGDSYVYCPLTEDYSVLRYFIRSISTELITSQGSLINQALRVAVKNLKDVNSKNPFILLISDGEDSNFEINSALQTAKESKVKINTLAVGTPQGGPIPEPNGTFITDRKGNIVISRLDTDNLRNLSEKSGGNFALAVYSDDDILKLLQSDENRELSSLYEKEINVYYEKGHLLALLALLLMWLCFLLRKEQWILCLFLTLLINNNNASAQETSEITRKGNLYQAYRAYQDSDYEKALEIFKFYNQKNPHDLKIKKALANSLYRTKNYDEAKILYDKIASSANLNSDKFEALYNSGNSSYKLGDYKTAVEQYKSALQINPADKRLLRRLRILILILRKERSLKKKKKKTEEEKEKEKEKEKKNKIRTRVNPVIKTLMRVTPPRKMTPH